MAWAKGVEALSRVPTSVAISVASSVVALSVGLPATAYFARDSITEVVMRDGARTREELAKAISDSEKSTQMRLDVVHNGTLLHLQNIESCMSRIENELHLVNVKDANGESFCYSCSSPQSLSLELLTTAGRLDILSRRVDKMQKEIENVGGMAFHAMLAIDFFAKDVCPRVSGLFESI